MGTKLSKVNRLYREFKPTILEVNYYTMQFLLMLS